MFILKRNSFLTGVEKTIEFMKQQISTKQELIQNYENLYAREEKKLNLSLNNIKKNDNFYLCVDCKKGLNQKTKINQNFV